MVLSNFVALPIPIVLRLYSNPLEKLLETGCRIKSITETGVLNPLPRYKAKSSGALVFGAGTVQWAWGLDNFHDSVTGMNNMWESECLWLSSTV